jgi:polyisoprenoid-binding protein YceI
MASVTSDQSQRNAQFDGRIMNVSAYPTAAFTLTDPIALGNLPPEGTVGQYPATGTLAMHGVTKQITFTVSAEKSAGSIYVLADIPIVFSDWNIANPSVGGLVTTQNSGTLEVLLHLTQGTGNAASTGSAGSQNPGGGGPITVPSTTEPPLSVPSN